MARRCNGRPLQWHDAPMSAPRHIPLGLHRIPRHPHAWLVALLLSQVLVVWIWWQLGWRVGLPLMFLSHAVFWCGTLVPGARLFSPVLVRLPIRDQRVWLTIDDGPSTQTPEVLDLLDAHGAKATFFLVGARAREFPQHVREIVRRGHGIGNHSDSHPAGWFWCLSPRQMAREIDQAQVTLTKATGVAPIWFRAVVGMANPFVAACLRRHGLARVAWSARGFDGSIADPARVVARVQRQLCPGGIVLTHENAAHGRSLEIVTALLDMLDAQGYGTVLPETLTPGSADAKQGQDAANARATG